MNTKMSKRQRDLKAKLMAAIAMLLVSSIMMVSTTYAWFTLSTAPEVTGITTAVGANGNLEMALLPASNPFTAEKDFGITTGVGDGVIQDITLKNATWGNLVDLSGSTYGLDQITLYPAALNATAGRIQAATPLSYPEYGPDGRITKLNGNTLTAAYHTGSNFNPDSDYGVRAVGSASGMTERQQTFRVAKSNAGSYTTTAANMASKLLQNKGSSLGNIAIQYGIKKAEAKFTRADVEALKVIADGLNPVFDEIEKAYLQYMLAYAASTAGGDDAAYTVLKGYINGANNDLDAFLKVIYDNGQWGNLPAELKTGVEKLGYYFVPAPAVEGGETPAAQSVAGSKGLVSDALNGYMEGTTQRLGLTALLAEAKDEYTWNEIRPILVKLANPNEMTVLGYAPDELMDHAGEVAGNISNGLNIEIKKGAGVFADIAEQTDNYTATGVVIKDVSFGGMNLGDVPVNMTTKVDPPHYLNALGTVIGKLSAPASSTGEVAISDMYGYIIDMAFKTNAAGSKLVLQQTPVDRIYTGSTGAADENGMSTMGNGANMTFTSPNATFGADAMKALMDNIVIVFFNANTGDIIHYAKLYTEGVQPSASGEIKAEIRLVEAPTSEDVTNYIHTNTQTIEGVSYTYYWKDAACTETVLYREWVATPAVPDDPNTDENETKPEVKKYQVAKYVDDTNKPLTNADGKYVDAEGNVLPDDATPFYEKKLEWEAETDTDPKLQGDGVVTPKGTYAWSSNQEIMELPQNTAVQLSALVYLDGNTVTNADVSATGSKSLSGAMNLQFSSTANLTPMNYTPLQSTTGSNTNGGTATEYTVAMAADSKTGITLKDATAKAVDGTAFVFELSTTEGVNKVEYLVGEASETNAYKTLTAGADSKYTIPAAEVKGNITIKVS